MAILQFDEYKSKLLALKPTLVDLAEALGLESAHQELDLLQAESAADGFWNDMDHAQKITTRIKNLQDKIDDHKKREAGLEDLLTLCEMGQEMEDEALVPEVEEGYEHLVQDLEKARALMRKLGCIVIHTENRAVEETAQEILRYYERAHPPSADMMG